MDAPQLYATGFDFINDVLLFLPLLRDQDLSALQNLDRQLPTRRTALQLPLAEPKSCWHEIQCLLAVTGKIACTSDWARIRLIVPRPNPVWRWSSLLDLPASVPAMIWV
jgi:hypothetical protein